MNLRRTSAIMLRYFYLLRGSPARVVPLFAWVAIDIVLWGFLTRYLNSVAASTFNFVPVLLGAVLLWDFFTRVMQGVTMTFFEDVWTHNFLNLFATRLTISEYLGGLVFSSVLTSSIGLVVMLVLATVLFGFSVFAYGVMLVPFLLVLFMFGIALGIFAAGLVMRLGPASEWLVWPIPALLSPFVGVFYPLSTLPAWMRWVGWGLPPAHIFEGARSIVLGGTASWIALLYGGGLALSYILLAGWFFLRMYRRAVRTGLIARYSAETLS